MFGFVVVSTRYIKPYLMLIICKIICQAVIKLHLKSLQTKSSNEPLKIFYPQNLGIKLLIAKVKGIA